MNLKDCDTCIHSRPVYSENRVHYICTKSSRFSNYCFLNSMRHYKRNPMRIPLPDFNDGCDGMSDSKPTELPREGFEAVNAIAIASTIDPEEASQALTRLMTKIGQTSKELEQLPPITPTDPMEKIIKQLSDIADDVSNIADQLNAMERSPHT